MNRKKNYNYNLKNIDGKKFRVMWSTKALYSIIYFIILISFTIFSASLIDRSSVIIDLYDFPPLLLLTPFIILIVIINDKFLGPIVAVINEKGIYTKDEHINWNNISMICYKKTLPSHEFNFYCCLEIYANKNTYIILHAPHKMVRHIKKYVPNVKVKTDKDFILITILFILVFSALPFLAYIK